jgi:basic membrane protein A
VGIRLRGLAAVGVSAALTVGASVAAFAAPVQHRSAASNFKVGIVESGNVLQDHGFIYLSYVGLMQAEKQLGVHGSYVLTNGQGDYVPDLTNYARQGYNLVIGISFTETSAVQQVAKEFPKTKFVLIDSEVSPLSAYPNVSSVIFDANQGAYLAGALCGYIEADKSIHWKGLVHNNILGIVGGQNIPPVDTYIAGFEAGAKYADPQAKFLLTYTGSFTDVTGGSSAALTQHGEGASIIFPVAGDTGLGVITAAKTHGFYSLGVDADQAYLAPHNVITSALKRVNVAVYDEIYAALHGTWHGGLKTFTLNMNGVGMAPPMKGVPASIIAKVNALRIKIENGSLKVPFSLGG